MGSRSYPLWVDISSCIYRSKKSYGVQKHSTQNIFVGTSAQNSHYFGKIELVHIPDSRGSQDKTFQIHIDGILIKEGRFEDGELKITKQVKQG